MVTGTLQAGTVHAGDELTATPSMRAVRVRGVQSLGSPAAQVSGVARVALNLRGVRAGSWAAARRSFTPASGRWPA